MKVDKKIAKSLVVLLSGSIISQLINIICSPFLTRIYGAENLGIYTYLLSITTIFMPIINFRYDMSIVTAKEEDLYSLLKGSLLIGIILTFLTSLGYTGYVVFFKKFELFFTVPYFLLILLSYSLINVFTAYNNRLGHYQIISQVTMIRSAVQNIGALLGGLINNGAAMLIIFYTIGQFAGVRKQGAYLRNKIKAILKIPHKEVLDILKEEYRQPVFSMPAILFNGLSYSLITIIVQNLYGFSEVGYYSISVRMLGIPLALISGNMSRIFFERATYSFAKEHSFYKEFKQIFLIQFLLAIPLTIGLMIFSPSLFSLFFGEKWRIAGEYVTILAPMFGIRFIVSTLSPGLIISKKQSMDFFLQILFIVSVIIIYMEALKGNFTIEKFLGLINIFFSIIYVLYLFFIYKYSKGEKA